VRVAVRAVEVVTAFPAAPRAAARPATAGEDPTALAVHWSAGTASTGVGPGPTCRTIPGSVDACADVPFPPITNAAGAEAINVAATRTAQSRLRISTSQSLTHWDAARPHSVARLP
jgi:hypothetical protein